MLYLGLGAFFLFFLSDLNDWHLQIKWLRPAFFVGVLLLVVSTVGLCYNSSPVFSMPLRILFAAFAVVFSVLTGYAVFSVFLLTSRNDDKTVYSDKLYGLCRHPGFLFFVPLYISLWVAFGLPAYAVVVFCILNLLLIIFEDTLVFPAYLKGYGDYKRTTPFLLPTPVSVSKLFGKQHKDGLL